MMDWAVLVVLQVVSWPLLSALFTVEAGRRAYSAEFQGDVTLGCRFRPGTPTGGPRPTVTWHRLSPTFLEVYRLDSGVENLASQDPGYRGRVRFLAEELDQGWAKVQVGGLRINDSGTYRCFVQMGTADYKTMTLSVYAPYKPVTKRIQRSAEGDEVELLCQSEGFPASELAWRDGSARPLSSNTTASTTPEQLVRVASSILVRSSVKNNYTCSLADGGPAARFNIPEEIPDARRRNDGLVVLLSVTAAVAVVVVAALVYGKAHGTRRRRQKPSASL